MYKETMFFSPALTERVKYIGMARDVLLEACINHVDPRFFQHENNRANINHVYVIDRPSGESCSAPPLITLSGRKDFISVTGLGNSGVALLNKEAPNILYRLASFLSSPIRIKEYSGKCKLKPSMPLLYRSPQMVVSIQNKAYNECKVDGKITLQSAEPLIKRAIINGLLGQVKYLDDDTGSSLEQFIGTDQMLGIKIISGNAFLLRAKHRDVLCIKDLVFSINLDMDGRWYGGHMRSFGYGAILKVRPA